jgi:hypothetical protein
MKNKPGRFFRKSAFNVAALVALALLALSSCGQKPAPLLPGDVLFQDFSSAQSRAIKLATDSKYSHVGIYFEQGGKQLVLEEVSPVKITFFKAWIGRNPDSSYAVRRLKDHDKILTDDAVSHLYHTAVSYLNVPYDLYFSWDDDRLYCSEFVWKVFKKALDIELCDRHPLGDYDIDQPEVHQKLEQRFGSDIPLEQLVVAPSDLYKSKKLKTIRP